MEPPLNCAEETQVHTHASPSSKDLSTEVDHLKSLLRAPEDRELALQSELQKLKAETIISELQGVPDIKNVVAKDQAEASLAKSDIVAKDQAEASDILDKDWIEVQEERSSQRRHSISGSNSCIEDINVVSKRRQSDDFIFHKEIEEQIEERSLRISNPPPRPTLIPSMKNKDAFGSIPPPLPFSSLPPPPPTLSKFSKKISSVKTKTSGILQRAPQVAELYYSLIKRDSRKENCGGVVGDTSKVANVSDSLIAEIQKRSSHLLAIKTDVETQGQLINSLIKDVKAAVYQDIEDIVAFIKWLDNELRFLVDERAVLKHFAWPEKKVDTLRQAAFNYLDLKKLESEATSYEDDLHLPCEIALKKMAALFEKIELNVNNLLVTRDVLMHDYNNFQIPIGWMLDAGLISKIKFASLKLAKKYMKRVAAELQAMGGSDKGPKFEYMLLHGVKFAFKIYQFAGGFDEETMQAFEELRHFHQSA